MLSDLWSVNDDMASRYCSDRFEAAWSAELRKPSPSLTRAFYDAFGFGFVIGGFYKFGCDTLAFASPILLNYILDFVEDPSQPAWQGYVYAVLLLLAVEMQSICVHHVCCLKIMTVLTSSSSAVLPARKRGRPAIAFRHHHNCVSQSAAFEQHGPPGDHCR